MSTASLQDAEKRLKRSIINAERSRKAFIQHRKIEGDIFSACETQLRSCNIQKVKSSSAGEERYSYLKSEHLLLWEKYDFYQQMPIVVTGPNSSGKSTFINKLIGKSIMPVDEGSVSKRVVRITYADVEEASLKVYDNYRHGVATNYGSPEETVPLSAEGRLLSTSELKSIMKKYLKPVKEATLIRVRDKQQRNGRSTIANAILDTTCSESDSPESDGNKEEDEVEEYEVDEESKDWYQKMVVVSIPSKFLKMGVDIYDTPGPDLRDDVDMALLRKNCSELLQKLVPLSVVVFLLPNPSASNDVRDALEVLTDAIGTVKEREPRVYFLHNKYCCSSLLYDHDVKESDPDYDTKVLEALETARNDSLETFRNAFPTPLLTLDEESGEELYDIVDMLDGDDHMIKVRQKVKRRLLSIASLHMDSLTNMLVKGLSAAVSNFYDQMEVVSTHSAKDIDEITKLMRKFEEKFRKQLKKDLKETLEEFPPLLVATLREERAGILEDFKSNPISTVKTGKEAKRKMYQGYFDSHNEIKRRLNILIKDKVVAKASLQLQQSIGDKVQTVLQETFEEFEKNEKYGPMLLKALDFDGVEEAIEVSGPSLKSNVGAVALSMASTAASIVFRVVIVDAVAAATVAAISVAFAAIGGVVFLTTVIMQIKKCNAEITEDRVREWVLEKLESIEKKYAKINPKKIIREIRRAIQAQILSRLSDNFVNFTNAQSMKTGIPRLREILGKFQDDIDELNCELALILSNDTDTSVDIGKCIHDGENCKVYSACRRDQKVVVRVPSPLKRASTREFHHDVVKLRHLNEWNVRNVVPFFGVTRVQLEDEETAGMTFLKMKGSLREYLTETPTVEGDFKIVLRMATCITESLESFLKNRDQNLAQTALNLDSSKLFIDDSGSCYVSDFFSENYPQGPYRRHGSCTSPQRNLHSDIRSLGAVLFELFPKKEYVPPNDDEEVLAEVKVLLEEERPKVQSMYLGIVANCFEEKSPPNPTEVLEGLTECDNLLD